ncbi:MAG: L-asparaginase [Bradyrhizobium sp.]|jgi:L-asparaginase|nr:L-asparaginase [Bradyrhizobium sp.]
MADKVTANVLVIYTGGTIGMTPSDPNNPASPLRPADKEGLAKYVPNPLEEIAWDIQGLVDHNGEPVGPLDSSSVGPKHWVYMAQAIEKAYEAYDGFVILHGTDTMAFTASALSFLLQNLSKPVIVTGSQLPIYRARTDAVLNFINALSIAGYRTTGLPKIPEVTICFGDVLLRGNRTTKVSTSRWQGFDSPNFPHLGKIGEHIVIDKALLLPSPPDTSPFFVHKAIEESVATLPLYPGMDPDILERVLSLDLKGVILRTFGTGNAPDNEDFIGALKKAADNGKIILNTTQCVEGVVEQGLYEASFGLQNVGVITGLDLTPEAALTKLMWLLATETHKEVATQMQISLRGEQSGSVFDIRFGEVGKKSKPLEVARLSERPSGQFQTSTLRRAMLRVSGVGMEGFDKGDEVRLSAFVNLPSANAETPITVPQFAGYLSGQYEGPEKTILLRDVTATIARVHETGRPINLTLVPPVGKKFWAEGAYLTLLNQ